MSEKPESLIPYDSMVENALRAVVHEAVQYASDKGLPGEHHFYITFRTDHPLTEMPDSIRAKYPTEIRIVLQNQFSNLYVDDFGFHVTLYFGGMPTPLYIPFDAIISFLDPHAQFSMRFEPKGMDLPQTQPPKDSLDPKQTHSDEIKNSDKGGDNVVSLSSFRKD